METFVENHLKLVELERTEEITNSQLLLTSSPKVLESKGLCLQRMRHVNTRTGLYGRTVAEFEYHFGSPPQDLPANTFSSGDLIGVYSERAPFPGSGDDGGAISAVLLKISSRTASLVLDDPSNAENLSDSTSYRFVKLGSDITYKRIKKGLLALKSKARDSPAAHLVDILFNAAPPAPTTAQPELTFFNENLDASQREAVAFALSRPDIAVIHGPPGTGKTTTVIELIRQALVRHHGHRKSRILACAPSNVAVDNLVERLAFSRPQPKIVRLGHAARVMPHIQKFSLEARLTNSDGWQLVKDVQREMDELRQRMTKKSGKEKKEGDKGNTFKLRHEMSELRKELKQREARALEEIYQRSEVILSTLTGLNEDKTLANVEFDLIIVDECSQSVEAACWLALLRGPRCVLAGDHLQLPPTVLSKEACKRGLELSLMERVLQLYPGDQVTRMLTTQYRMHADIMDWSAKQFYEGKLSAHPSVSKHSLGTLSHLCAEEEDIDEVNAALIFIDTAGCGVTETVVEQSRGNIGEAELVRFFVERRISDFGLRQEEVGVITPYNLQVEFIRNRLKPKFPSLEIRTVDGFQGREKEVIILSLVRSNAEAEVGFLSEHRRLNVAVTRGKRQVVVICDSETLTRSKDKVLHGFIDYLRDRATIIQTAQEFIDSADVDIGTVHANDFVISEETTSKKSSGNKKKNKNKAKKNEIDKPNEKMRSGKSATQPTKRKESSTEPAEEEEFRKELVDFTLSDQTEKHFPTSLTGRQRAIIHEIAESLELLHISEGEGNQRHIVISKRNAAPSAGDDANTAADDANTVDDDTNVTDNKIVISSTTSETVSNQVSENLSNLGSGDQISSCLGATGIAGDVHQVSEQRQKPPEDNIMRQLREYQEREHQRRQQQLRGKHQKELEAHRTRKAVQSGKTLASVPSDDFDALIAAATALDSICGHPDCSTKVKTLGFDCSVCGNRYCSSHRVPETHGCGRGAKAEARKVISREGRIYSGSGIPSKKPDANRRAHLERRLDKKIDEMSEKRKSKEKKTKQ